MNPRNSCVEVLTSSTYDYDIIWKRIKMKSFKLALTLGVLV